MVSRPTHATFSAVLTIFGSTRVTTALTLATVCTAFLSQAITRLIGSAGLGGVLFALVVLTALSLAGRRDQLEWKGLLPISLMAFVGWCVISMIWSQYN